MDRGVNGSTNHGSRRRQEVSAEAARLLMQRLDKDGSGTVSFDEWIEG